MLDVGALEGRFVIARGNGVFVDEVAVLVVEHRYIERALLEVAAQTGLVALAFFRFQVRIRFHTVARSGVIETPVQRLRGRGAETFGVLAVPGVIVVEGVGQAELGRDFVPGLVFVADGATTVGGHGVEEFLGDVRFEFGVVVAQARHEGPVVPADLILGKHAVGVDGWVREVAGLSQHIGSAGGADGGAAATDCQARTVAAARASDFLLLEGGAVSQQVFGVGDAEAFIQLCVEHPLLFFVERVAGAQHLAGDREVDLVGALVGLGDLVVQAPLDVVHQQAVEGEAVFQAEAFTGNGVVTGTRLVHAAGQDTVGNGRCACKVRTAVGAFLIGVAIVLVLLVGQAQACVVFVVPADLGQHAGGAYVFRVGGGARQAGAVVAAVGFGFMTIALAVVQQAVELIGATGHSGGLEPALVSRAVTGLQPRADVLARLDDVVRVEGEVADRAADGVAAIQHRRRTTEDFDAFDDFRVDVVALGLGVRAVEETVGDFHAIDLRQDPVTVDAADVVAADPAASTGPAHRNAWLVAHQVLDGVDVVAVQFIACVDGDGAGHAVHVLLVTRGTDGHLLQVQGAGGGAAFEHDVVVVAQFAVAQVGPHQQAIKGFFRRQRSAHARRRHAFSQLCRQAHLPASHGGKGVERRDQRLRRDGERVVAHIAARLLGAGGHDWRSAGHQDGGGQQRQHAGR
ncbi:hypothetical protein D3C72_916060 [compost metagenome]